MLGKILGLSTLLITAAGAAHAQGPAYGNAPAPAPAYGNGGNGDNGGYGAGGQGQDYGNYAAPAPASGSAWQTNTPFYVEGSLGVVMPNDSTGNTVFNNRAGLTTSGHNKTGYDLGPQMSVALGYRVGGGLRVAGEFGYGHFTTSTLRPQSTTGSARMLNGSAVSTLSGGDNNFYTLTANVYYDLPFGGPVRPYIGAGAGWYHLDGGTLYFADSAGANLFSQTGLNSDNGLVQGELGVTVQVSPRWSVVPSYRYAHLFGSTGPTMDLHLFKVGARYGF